MRLGPRSPTALPLPSSRCGLSSRIPRSGLRRSPLAAVLALGALAACQCGPDAYEPLELRELSPADESEFDVDWAPGTLLADESAVLRDLEDLQPHDGVFKLSPGSSLLDGVEVGSIVVWPQVGIFEILELSEQEGKVRVSTKWARFSDAVERAHITFEHALRAGESGRAVGVVPIDEEAGTGTGSVAQALSIGAGPVSYSEDGLEYSGEEGQYGVDTELDISDDVIRVQLSAGSDEVTAEITGELRGLKARGFVFLNPDEGDDDPSVLLHFDDIQLDVEAELNVQGARGSAEIAPRAVLVFPFMVGPVPAYVAVGVRLGVRSTISSDESFFSTSAGFSMRGAVTLARNDDGSFAAEGGINDFEARSPDISFETTTTAGIGIDVDAPRISFGLGRPGIATGSVYGTHSVEITANAALAPGGDYCARVNTGAAVLAGGELAAFGWSVSSERQVTTRRGEGLESGPSCD